MTFLKAQGVRGLVGKNDWPRFVEEEPEVYEREELEKLFAVCDEEERLWYEFFLMTGMREQEVMHCSWADVNLTRSTVTVRYKPEYGFSPKNYREREIPIPAKLVTSLKAWKAKAEKFCGLVFPTAGCSPTQLSRRPESRRRTCESRQRELLASQIPCDICDVASLE